MKLIATEYYETDYTKIATMIAIIALFVCSIPILVV